MRAVNFPSYEDEESVSLALNSAVGERVRDSELLSLSQRKARHLEESSLSFIPSLFQQLVATNERGSKRPALMEVACAPDSLLTRAVQDLAGREDSASCSLWNSSDLSTPEGLRLV